MTTQASSPDYSDAVRQLIDVGVAVIPQFWTDCELNAARSACRELIDQAVDSYYENHSNEAAFESLDARPSSLAEPVKVFATGKQQKADLHFLRSVDRVSYFYEPQLDASGRVSVNKIGHALHQHHQLFRRLTFSDRVQQIVRTLGWQRPIVPQSMLIVKNAHTGGKVHPHRDATFLYTEPDTRLVGIWIPLESCDKQNGCLWYVPGSHRNRQRKRFVRKDSLAASTSNSDPDNLCTFVDQHLESEYSPEAFVPLEIEAGSCVLIDGFVVHQSHENQSNRSRPAFALHLLEMSDQVKWPASNWLQPTPNYQFPLLYDQNVKE